MKTAAAARAVLVAAGILAAAVAARTGAAPSAAQPARSAAPDAVAVGAPEPESPAKKAPVTSEFPAITVTDKKEDHLFWLLRGVTVCRGCPNCLVEDAPGERWLIEATGMRDENAPAFFPAVVFTLQGDRIALHWRRLATVP